MGDLIVILIIFGIGFWLGRVTAPKPKSIPPKLQRRNFTYTERQKLKVMYESDADRIRELNALSKNEGSFLRLLKQEFSNNEVVVKRKRFFIVDSDKYPIAIFEYRDGNTQLRNSDVEDGLPLFLYKGVISSEAIREDAELIAEKHKIRPTN
ncbi:hypothetical protein [Acinetobacter radioresistens]|uniref:hypothetical protein n=1 Tax=Acinetobacter radioresistens TaxID=40216 RepID=UPI00200432BC|nr:hypothetical protein [Acinetobacter radioresistens]MCK4101363.1 hypothetical protein [Acinetobacter radioresistens]